MIAENRLVMAEGEPTELTPIEFRLLHLLLRNPGRVFSRSYLLETVWQGENPDDDRAVDQVVSRLRKKLGERENMIEMVWGKGYRMGKVVEEA